MLASWPARLRQWGNDGFLQRRLRRQLYGEQNHLSDVRRILQVPLVGHGDALLDEAVEEVCAHAAGDDRRDPDAVGAAFHAQRAAEADETPFGGMIRRGTRPGA